MDEDFNPDELRPDPYRPDTELMLGPWQLGGIFFVFVLICGTCFLLGYALGRHGAHSFPAAGQLPGIKASSTASGSASKPSAGPQAVYRAQPAGNSQSSPEASNAASVPDSASLPAAGSAQPAVKPTLTDSATTPALMVQIAAVSHQEDADVLVAALRKRGFAVAARRDPADNLLHVRIGPFASLNDANATRQKLLNDGYNAVVQP